LDETGIILFNSLKSSNINYPNFWVSHSKNLNVTQREIRREISQNIRDKIEGNTKCIALNQEEYSKIEIKFFKKNLFYEQLLKQNGNI